MILNPDNLVTLRGKPIHDDYSKFYKVAKSDYTVLYFWIKIYNSTKSYKNKKPTFDHIPVTVFGHIKDEKHPKGGLAEQLLSRVSKELYVTLYCHIDTSEFLAYGVHRRESFSIVLDGFRMENQTLVVRANTKVKQEKKAIKSLDFIG